MSTAAEFSRLYAPDGLPPGGATVTLEANAEERRALAKRFDLVRLDLLAGEVSIERAGEDLLHVSGRLRARLAQRCVVTLDPVEATVEAEFDRLFSRAAPLEAEEEIEIDPEAELPEPLPEGGLDLGEILAEELSLALDPYPRSPDADAKLAELGIAGDDAAEANPFAALASLRKH
ncbi:YceD family protein [Benzoatithermus flavus]|uniref:DUF177 domain-containing protein n=1 Tax=Benzoatithermus flavus TaxID=3108223 RepID=A0ABU8XWD2_9PROT